MARVAAAALLLLLLPPAVVGQVPLWPPTYALNASTIAMVCSYTGYMEGTGGIGAGGILDYDWSNALDLWSNSTPMDTEERMLVQAAMTKQAAPDTRVWIYRNSAYAYPWFTDVRFILDDEDYSPWFIKYRPGPGPFYSPPCDSNYEPPKCSNYFHTQMDTPKPPGQRGYGTCTPPACNCGSKPCGFYVFNHSSDAVVHGQSFQDWFIDSYVLNAAGMSPAVSGFYWDDYFSPTGDMGDNTPNATEDMGLTPADLLQLTASYRANMAVLANRTIASGRFAWQLFDQHSVRSATCAADLRTLCAASSPTQSRALLYLLEQQDATWAGANALNDLANFLLVRGDHAWLGLTWMGCSRNWRAPPASWMSFDLGQPEGLCAETAPGSGVFTRLYERALVTTDCGSYNSSVCARGGGACLQPPAALPVAITTYFKVYNPGHWDHAPCATRDCNVYSGAGYEAVFTEGTCLRPGEKAAEPLVNVTLFYTTEDNMGAPAAPADGQSWGDYDLECLAFANNAAGRWPLEVWHSAARAEYWTLASPASRANATAEGYTLYASIGFVTADSGGPLGT